MTFCVSGAATKVFLSAIALISSFLLALPQKVYRRSDHKLFTGRRGIRWLQQRSNRPISLAIVEEQYFYVNQRAWSELEKIERKDMGLPETEVPSRTTRLRYRH